MMKYCVLTLGVLFSLEVFAEKPLTVTKSVYIKDTAIKIDDQKSSTPIKCDAYSTLKPKAEGVKATLSHKSGLNYDLFCEGSEVGSHWNLIIKKKAAKLDIIKYTVSNNLDGEDRWRTDAWLIDLNNDGFLDLVQLYKQSQQDLMSGRFKVVETNFKVFYWNAKDQKFKPQHFSKKIQSKMVKQFQFQ